ncbi:uncharacterized protein [Globicephala melas]|uniref:uncharacterized protein n=1 Tax=Globicephala melas TaxID=9731 RepID=UPI00293D3F02|nr:uncharacterized protein LOC115848713 [Globicephala melas]
MRVISHNFRDWIPSPYPCGDGGLLRPPAWQELPRDLLQRLRPPLALGPSYPPALSCLSPALPPSALNGPWSPESSVFLQLPLCLSDSPWAASRGHPGRPAPSPADGLPQGKEQLLARRPFPGLRVSGRSTAVASLSRRVSPDQHLPRVLRHEAPSVHWSPTRLHGQRPPLHVSKLKALGVLIPDPRASNTHSDPRPGALPCSPQPGVEARSGPALAQGRAGSSPSCGLSQTRDAHKDVHFCSLWLPRRRHGPHFLRSVCSWPRGAGGDTGANRGHADQDTPWEWRCEASRRPAPRWGRAAVMCERLRAAQRNGSQRTHTFGQGGRSQTQGGHILYDPKFMKFRKRITCESQ